MRLLLRYEHPHQHFGLHKETLRGFIWNQQGELRLLRKLEPLDFYSMPKSKFFWNTVKTDGVNQSKINGDKLMNDLIPYCSLPESKEIVRICAERPAIEVKKLKKNIAKKRASRKASV